MILVVDNYDSFTYNLVQYLGILGNEVRVVRNDDLSVEDVKELEPSRIVLSPGPGRPEDAGIMVEIIRRLGATIPILGVCLGHQAIAYAYGGEVGPAVRLMHGKEDKVFHNEQDIFWGIPQGFSSGLTGPESRWHFQRGRGLRFDGRSDEWGGDPGSSFRNSYGSGASWRNR